MNANLQALLAQRFRVKIVTLTILVSDWSGRDYYYYDDDLMFATDYMARILPIPSSQEFIDHYVTCEGAGTRQVSGVYRGYALFRCASLPNDTLTFPVLILY